MSTRYVATRLPRTVWDVLLQREVWQWPDGRVALQGFTAGAVKRWRRKHFPQP